MHRGIHIYNNGESPVAEDSVLGNILVLTLSVLLHRDISNKESLREELYCYNSTVMVNLSFH